MRTASDHRIHGNPGIGIDIENILLQLFNQIPAGTAQIIVQFENPVAPQKFKHKSHGSQIGLLRTEPVSAQGTHNDGNQIFGTLFLLLQIFGIDLGDLAVGEAFSIDLIHTVGLYIGF